MKDLKKQAVHDWQYDFVNAKWYDHLVMSWMNRMTAFTLKNELTDAEESMFIPKNMMSEHLIEVFKHVWEKDTADAKVSLFRILLRLFRKRLLFSTVAIFGYMFCSVTTAAVILPVLLERIGEFTLNITAYETVQVASLNVPYEGLYWALAMAGLEVVRIISAHGFWTINILIGVNVRSLLIGALYSKLVKLASVGSETGIFLNMLETDTQRILDACIFGPFLIVTPLFLLFSVVASYFIIGYSALIGFLFVPLVIPVQFYLGKKIAIQRRKGVKFTDNRVSLMAELLRASQLVKMYNWEESFAGKVSDIRNKEVVELWKTSFYKVINTVISDGLLTACSIITFVFHVLVFGNELTPEDAFSFIAVINSCRFPLNVFALAVRVTSESFIGLNRIKKFLLIDEFKAEQKPKREDIVENFPVVQICSAKYQRDIQEDHRGSVTSGASSELFISNLIVQKATLTMIVGRVGSGKTSLLTGALLGEIRLVNSSETGCKAVVCGRIAYVSQVPWVFNGTVKENIILTRNYDPTKFKDIVKLCCLEPDIQMFPGGEETELGERGINISGGQKTRIALARALYSDADLYVLDDVLSAVDAHVSKSLFYDCILNYLVKRGKTVVLATHAVNYFHEADNLVVLKDMRILDQGKYSELLTREDENHRNLVISCMSTDEGDHKKEQVDQQNVDSSTSMGPEAKMEAFASNTLRAKSKGKLLQKEKIATGAVSFKTIQHYVGSSGGMCLLGIILFMFFFTESIRALADVWISFWTADSISAFNNREYAIFHGIIILGLSLCLLIKGSIFAAAALNAATRLHNLAFDSVLAATMAFFNVTELGIVLNRFSGDIDKMDVAILNVAEIVLSFFFRICISLSIIAFITPSFVIILLPVLYLFFVLLNYCRKVLRKLKRIELMSKTPLVGHCESTVKGLSTIKAFEEDKKYVKKALDMTNLSSRSLTAFLLVNRWIGMRLDIISAWIILCTAVFAVVFAELISASLAGLMITSALQCSGILQFATRQAAELEANFTSVERLRSFVVDTPKEKQLVREKAQITSSWPEKGSVEFVKYSTRYRGGLPNVLNEISLSIKGGQKAALTGRTGSGKSTTLLCLFRILEASAGQILIDGVDIASVPLARLRSTALSIVPQDAVLFKGSIRSNLDPFNNFSDEEIWSALKRVHLTTPNESNGLSLKLTGSESSKDLGYPVEEGGDNLSKGQRQLLCFARALLRNSRIICIDEGTSSVDETSDQLIQQTLRESFANNTLVIIAHRLKTVRDVDVIFVLSEGRVIEEGAPEVLINKENGVFSEMWKAQV